MVCKYVWFEVWIEQWNIAIGTAIQDGILHCGDLCGILAYNISIRSDGRRFMLAPMRDTSCSCIHTWLVTCDVDVKLLVASMFKLLEHS